MPNGLIKFIWFTTKWFATFVALAGLVVTALFVYDLSNHARWGYPWWLLIVLIATSGVAWILRMEAAWLLREIIDREATSPPRHDSRFDDANAME